jgi:cell division protein FtsI (penicillin-binding protein 3)
MSIGQEISVTAVQILSAFAAIANGGRLMQPQIVRAVLDAQGREASVFEPKAVRQVISPETARELTTIMTAVVREGTGHNAAIPGYEVAGKTGTAQKMDPATRRYSHAPGILSFVGFAPADDPRMAMIVLLDEPKNEKWGSEAAAPIFSAIGREALRHMNVPPRGTTPVPILRADSSAIEVAGAVPAIRLASLEEASDASGVMPALQGRSLRRAMAALASFDVALEVHGHGVVVAQSPAPGTPMLAGMPCRLTLAGPAGQPAASQ